MSGPVTLLHHPTSQPCRAVHQFLLEIEAPHEVVVVNLMDGENETEEFKSRYNPTGQVPILVDGDFTVWESAAIGFYINERFAAPAHWFGGDIRQRARIHQYLHWHSTVLRRGAGAFFYTHFAECIWGKRDYSAEIAKGRWVLNESLAQLDAWLSSAPYLCGEDISFADLMAQHELVSHTAGKIIPDAQWDAHPHLKAWFAKLNARPHARTVSEMIMAVGAMRLAGQPIPMTRKTSLAKGTEIIPGGVPA